MLWRTADRQEQSDLVQAPVHPRDAEEKTFQMDVHMNGAARQIPVRWDQTVLQALEL